MALHTLDLVTFRLLYPAFANVTTYPDAYIQAQWDAATAYIGEYDGCLLADKRLQLALNLMTAHLMHVNVLLAQSGVAATIGVPISATVDKVTVSNMPPPATDGWKFWLATSPYGLQLWALLSAASAGGVYIGGSPERRGFRKVGGRF